MILNFLENLLCQPRVDDASSILLKFGANDALCIKDFYEGLCISGGIGSGKTSLATVIRESLLRHMFGLLVLCVKNDEADEWEQLAIKTGRASDLIRFRVDGPHRFNPFIDANPLTVVAFLDDFGSMLEDKEKSPYWRAECNKSARNAAVITHHALGKIDLGVMANIIGSHARDLDQVGSKAWRDKSTCYQLIMQAEKRAPGNHDVMLAKEFFLEIFPAYDPRTRGNVLAVLGNLLENFRREPFRSVFGGNSTVTPEDILERRKIVVVDIPVLKDQTVGTIANGIWLFAFCRALTRRTTRHPAALYIDEAQFLISSELMRTQSVIRSHNVSTILLFQNLAVLEERLPKAAVEGLLGTINTMIFTRQAHAQTRQWAADRIDKAIAKRETKNRSRNYGGGGGSSTSESEEKIWDYKFHPSMFGTLKTGGRANGYKVETIVLAGAKAFRAKWHQLRPGKGYTVKPG